MERGNSKHGPRLDNEMDREVRGYTQGGPGAPRVEEWHDPEPAGEDQPEGSSFPTPDTPRRGGAPTGITATEAEQRSRLGTYLPRTVFPADQTAIRQAAQQGNAPDDVLAALDELPQAEYQTVAEVWAALGRGIETHRW
jgi:hypothetical protein